MSDGPCTCVGKSRVEDCPTHGIRPGRSFDVQAGLYAQGIVAALEAEPPKCTCKLLASAYKMHPLVVRVPKLNCAVHYPKPPMPIPWDQPGSDPLGDISKVMTALTPPQYRSDDGEQTTPRSEDG